MVASIGVIASPSQGVSYYEKDSYHAKDDPAHGEASAWIGRRGWKAGAIGSGRSRDLQGHARRKGAGQAASGQEGQGQEDPPSAGAGHDAVGAKSMSLMALVEGDDLPARHLP